MKKILIERFKSFRCGTCGYQVTLGYVKHQFYQYKKGIYASVPENVLLPVCSVCGEFFLDEEWSKYLNSILQKENHEQK